MHRHDVQPTGRSLHRCCSNNCTLQYVSDGIMNIEDVGREYRSQAPQEALLYGAKLICKRKARYVRKVAILKDVEASIEEGEGRGQRVTRHA